METVVSLVRHVYFDVARNCVTQVRFQIVDRGLFQFFGKGRKDEFCPDAARYSQAFTYIPSEMAEVRRLEFLIHV